MEFREWEIGKRRETSSYTRRTAYQRARVDFQRKGRTKFQQERGKARSLLPYAIAANLRGKTRNRCVNSSETLEPGGGVSERQKHPHMGSPIRIASGWDAASAAQPFSEQLAQCQKALRSITQRVLIERRVDAAAALGETRQDRTQNVRRTPDPGQRRRMNTKGVRGTKFGTGSMEGLVVDWGLGTRGFEDEYEACVTTERVSVEGSGRAGYRMINTESHGVVLACAQTRRAREDGYNTARTGGVGGEDARRFRTPRVRGELQQLKRSTEHKSGTVKGINFDEGYSKPLELIGMQTSFQCAEYDANVFKKFQ
ncbi:hypothetical protein C8R44DRAFT_738176 [Mycena epipterygia]|nr:hypothetical protein C8R44DRAFT_738176 [Mycena epipterygia]